ncbi:uncharacterized protein si:rp71-46j2.7 [Synchiropus splendidus]|uniref:uncharacterized protein si:rp71-46j2.7 n=1 Tax=Synchiropus splendidus TaxID=270530 RepID=UPI00237D4F88|nr:uncharacterized protein si:rp71-46j2.7 [Synchiropus splendidus]
MYLWRVCVAVALGLVWYFSDWGRTVTQYFLCFFFCLSTPLVVGHCGRESSTQTDEETSLKETANDELELTGEAGSSTAELEQTDYPHVKRSLQQVFSCAYGQLVSPWYTVPEPSEQQPLHQVLSREFDFAVDRLIHYGKDFDVCQAAVGSIRILTQHLHNSKQQDRELLFSSKEEEFALLREFSDVLVRNIFPEHLWSQGVVGCALNEIIALKGVGLLVKWLSDPDNLNQLVVNQLDGVNLKDLVEEQNVSDPEQTSLASQEGEEEEEEEEGSEVVPEGAGISTGDTVKRKKKGNKLKKGWSKFKDKMKSKKAKKKKMKKIEQQLVLRIMTFQGDEDDVSSREGSIYSQESDREDNEDLETYLTSVQEDMLEFKLSYEMWRVGCWRVSIPHADWINDELVFTVHLEEPNSPENLQWDIRKTYMDVIYFRNGWQDSTGLPPILELDKSEVSDEIIEEARASVEHFLQALISDDAKGHTQPVFQFLCPLEKLLNEEEDYRGVWGLLSGLASFLTPGQEEEESCPQSEVPKQNPSLPPTPTQSSAPSTQNEKDHDVQIPTIVITEFECDPDPSENEHYEKEALSEPSTESCSQDDKQEDSDNPLAAHIKMIFKGLTRTKSQESLVSTKNSGEEDLPSSALASSSSLNGGIHGDNAESSPWLSFATRSNKKEKLSFRVSSGSQKNKGKDHPILLKGGDAKNQANLEQLETTKAIFDLLKEISGNSILINIFDAILKPVMPILKKKVNSFLNKMNPSEEQMAVYIDTLRGKQWPETPAAPDPPRTEEEKNETRERANELITSRYSNILVLKKTDMEAVFNLFQDCEENKTLVYMLLSFLLREFFPHERSLNVSSAALQRVTTSSS